MTRRLVRGLFLLSLPGSCIWAAKTPNSVLGINLNAGPDSLGVPMQIVVY